MWFLWPISKYFVHMIREKCDKTTYIGHTEQLNIQQDKIREKLFANHQISLNWFPNGSGWFRIGGLVSLTSAWTYDSILDNKMLLYGTYKLCPFRIVQTVRCTHTSYYHHKENIVFAPYEKMNITSLGTYLFTPCNDLLYRTVTYLTKHLRYEIFVLI